MNPDTIKALKDALTPLAEKFGQTAEQVFALRVRQQYVVAGTITAALLLCAVALVAFCVWGYRDNWNEPVPMIGASVFGFAGVYTLMAFFIEAVPRFANPQWYAIHAILTAVGGK